MNSSKAIENPQPKSGRSLLVDTQVSDVDSSIRFDRFYSIAFLLHIILLMAGALYCYPISTRPLSHWYLNSFRLTCLGMSVHVLLFVIISVKFLQWIMPFNIMKGIQFTIPFIGALIVASIPLFHGVYEVLFAWVVGEQSNVSKNMTTFLSVASCIIVFLFSVLIYILTLMALASRSVSGTPSAASKASISLLKVSLSVFGDSWWLCGVWVASSLLVVIASYSWLCIAHSVGVAFGWEAHVRLILCCVALMVSYLWTLNVIVGFVRVISLSFTTCWYFPSQRKAVPQDVLIDNFLDATTIGFGSICKDAFWRCLDIRPVGNAKGMISLLIASADVPCDLDTARAHADEMLTASIHHDSDNAQTMLKRRVELMEFLLAAKNGFVLIVFEVLIIASFLRHPHMLFSKLFWKFGVVCLRNAIFASLLTFGVMAPIWNNIFAVFCVWLVSPKPMKENNVGAYEALKLQQTPPLPVSDHHFIEKSIESAEDQF